MLTYNPQNLLVIVKLFVLKMFKIDLSPKQNNLDTLYLFWGDNLLNC